MLATTCVLPGATWHELLYKLICIWLLLILGLEVPRQGQAVNQGWLLLVLGPGPLRERYGAC